MDLKDKVKTKIFDALADKIDASNWKDIADDAVEEFITSELPTLIKQHCRSIFYSLIESDEWKSNYVNHLNQKSSEAMEEIIKKSAIDIFSDVIGRYMQGLFDQYRSGRTRIG